MRLMVVPATERISCISPTNQPEPQTRVLSMKIKPPAAKPVASVTTIAVAFAAASAAIEFPETTLAISNASKAKATPDRMIASLFRSALYTIFITILDDLIKLVYRHVTAKQEAAWVFHPGCFLLHLSYD